MYTIKIEKGKRKVCNKTIDMMKKNNLKIVKNPIALGGNLLKSLCG